MEQFKSVTVKRTLGSLPDDTTYWDENDWEEHRKYVERLKKEGRLGEEVEYTVHFKSHPFLDTPQPKEELKGMAYFIPTGKKKWRK